MNSSFPSSDFPPRHTPRKALPDSAQGLPAAGESERVRRVLEELEARFAAGESEIELHFEEFRLKVVRPSGDKHE